MRIVFAGTPEFARVSLQALVLAQFEVVLVLSQPDRPAGRGLKLQASPVKQWAADAGLTVIQPRSLRLDGKFPLDAEAARDSLQAARPEVMVVAAYGLILPTWVLALPTHGCLNVHASLLPRWRGAAPIQRAILAGDAETGVTIMQMDQGLDTGGMLLKRAIAIGTDETAGDLHDRLATLGALLIVEALGTSNPAISQDNALATYAAKITKEEAVIDWREDAEVIARKVRAYNPFPGAATTLGSDMLKVWRAHAVDGSGEPGVIAAGSLRVGCGKGLLQITELQRAGGKRMAAAAFLAGAQSLSSARSVSSVRLGR